MNIILRLSIFLILWTIGATDNVLHAQRRPKKSDGAGISREDAIEQKKKQRAAKVAEYEIKKKHLQEIQSKSTQKRMKKSLKRAQKLSKGTNIPLHKRIFRRRKVA